MSSRRRLLRSQTPKFKYRTPEPVYSKEAEKLLIQQINELTFQRRGREIVIARRIGCLTEEENIEFEKLQEIARQSGTCIKLISEEDLREHESHLAAEFLDLQSFGVRNVYGHTLRPFAPDPWSRWFKDH